MRNIVFLIVFSLLLQGCTGFTSMDKEELAAEYGPENALDYISNNKDDAPGGRSAGNRFGWHRNDSSEADLDEDMSMHDLIDRQRIAEGLSNLLVQTPEVEKAGVLITNEYALAAFQTEEEDTGRAAKHVKMMVEAAVPYFFITVVTDNPSMIEDLEAYKGMTARSKDGHAALRNTIDTMREMTEQPVTPKEKAGSMEE
ncbi:YhcN/YlaJ family sporulation lipoprotein [Salibacterium aidingense]|uniref:YhcN/YlaJ family sporulation lipoprotein n=1 Tax=Salibacterium aidingense TaxID=384933 RepID=UPI000404801E|nr:YhcN/YlaJ family sporulation lipoprotein [Salibacterium aidingense]